MIPIRDYEDNDDSIKRNTNNNSVVIDRDEMMINVELQQTHPYEDQHMLEQPVNSSCDAIMCDDSYDGNNEKIAKKRGTIETNSTTTTTTTPKSSTAMNTDGKTPKRNSQCTAGIAIKLVCMVCIIVIIVALAIGLGIGLPRSTKNSSTDTTSSSSSSNDNTTNAVVPTTNRTEWPELLGKPVDEGLDYFQTNSEYSNYTIIIVNQTDPIVSTDYIPNRIRIYIAPHNNTIIKVPRIGR